MTLIDYLLLATVLINGYTAFQCRRTWKNLREAEKLRASGVS